MPEFIERQNLIDNLNKFAPEHYDSLVNQLIMKQPTVNVVEVVRCKECNDSERIDNVLYCNYFNKDVSENDYCSNGG